MERSDAYYSPNTISTARPATPRSGTVVRCRLCNRDGRATVGVANPLVGDSHADRIVRTDGNSDPDTVDPDLAHR
jgi:hypothetical protein